MQNKNIYIKEETRKQDLPTKYHIFHTKQTFFATKWSKNILLQLAKTLHHFLTILFGDLKFIHIIKRRIHHTLATLHHQ